MSPSFFTTYAEPDIDLQKPAAVAVVMASLARPSLSRSLASVFAQDLPGTIQVLIGIDRLDGDLMVVEQACRNRPAHIVVQVMHPGYSTSTRHGGLCRARDGGALRLILTSLANSRYVAYLDDDNWWAPDHLSSLHQAIAGADWAFSLRWFIHPVSLRPICVDQWESVGPERGIFAQRAGGFVDPNALMIDQIACAWAVPWWSQPVEGDALAMSADRNVFNALRQRYRSAETGQATAFYVLNPDDEMHELRMGYLGAVYAVAGG